MCSRIVWQGKGSTPVIVGRNMDWFEELGTNLWVLPRDTARDGLAPVNSLTWKSRYGSLVATAYDIGAVDGVNEKGLDGNLLFLAESDYGPRDSRLPGLTVSLWLQFYLDHFATVREAVQYTMAHPFQLRPLTAGISKKMPINVHLSLADPGGDSAILEFVGGNLDIYHDRSYQVMTNSPTFDLQLEGLRRYKGFGGGEELPGSTRAADRFVRAAYYLRHLPEAGTERQAIAGVLSVMRNVSQPFGTSDPAEPNISPSLWRTVADLTNGLYFFEATTRPNIVWIDAKTIDFAAGSGVRKLDLVHHQDLIGDVTPLFRPAAPFKPAAPDPEKTPMAATL